MKYKLLQDEYIDVYGTRLYRIEALKSFGNVNAGEKGGYIEGQKEFKPVRRCMGVR